MSSGRDIGSAGPDGMQYHLEVAPGALPPTVLLPGDPSRVAQLASIWDTAEHVADHREYRSVRGVYRGVPVGACSTGIGGPSAEIAVNELAAVGCRSLIRVGTTGSLQESIRCGDVVITTGAVRWDGASDAYAPPAYPAVASYEVVLALLEACDRLHLTCHLGISATASSFYAGQGRAAYGGYRGVDPERVTHLQAMGVLNLEMESATVLTLASLLGLRAGAACVVVADRVRGELRTDGADDTLARLGAEAAVALAEMDRARERAGKPQYVPALGLR
jgi:uridine phosphorylase